MSKLLLVVVVLGALFYFSISDGDVYVSPYLRGDGTHVRGHYRSDPNETKLDNWSTKGNVNPYTGKPGYKNP